MLDDHAYGAVIRGCVVAGWVDGETGEAVISLPIWVKDMVKKW